MFVVFSILCLLLILTVLVVVHEAGHATVARLCGVRVTEFFVGMPWGPEVSWRSKRSGIKYGATFALLGGYTKIAGMVSEPVPLAPLALALVNARGCLSVEDLARVAGCDPYDAAVTLATLADWGSIEEVWEPGERRRRSDLPSAYRSVRRDAHGLTVYDRHHDFSLPGSTVAGEPFFPDCSAEEFLAREKARTYGGVGFWKRMAILVAGVVCNVVLALALIMAFCMVAGVPTATGIDQHIAVVAEGSPADVAGLVVGDEIVVLALALIMAFCMVAGVPTATGIDQHIAVVAEGSPADVAGLVVGDEIVAVDGVAVDGAEEAVDVLSEAMARGSFEVEYVRDGEAHSAVVDLGDAEAFGINYSYIVEDVPLGPAESLSYALTYTGEVAKSVVSLLVPTRAGEVLQDSAGVVGIAVLTQNVVAQGFWPAVLLAAMLSMSLGWMNLLPIPPLDGGKGLIEIIQVIIRRPVPLRVQSAMSMVGIGLFLLLFVYMVFQDVSSLFKGLIEIIQVIIRRPVPLRVQSAMSMVGIGLFLLLFVYMVFQDVSSLFGA